MRVNARDLQCEEADQRVQVKPLLKDVLNNEMLEGTGNIDVNVQGQSLTPSGIQKIWSVLWRLTLPMVR